MICLFVTIVQECACMHPMYTDFEDLRNMTIGKKDISGMDVCNLIQGSTYYISKQYKD